MSGDGTGREQNAAKYPVEIPGLPPERIDRITSVLKPYLRILQPKLYGVENLPADGSLLVGNHTIVRRALPLHSTPRPFITP